MSLGTALAPRTEPAADAGAKQCVGIASPEDKGRRRFAGARPGGGRLTVEQRISSVWEGLLAVGAAECPVCRGRMERRGAAGRCADCGSTLV